MTSICGFRSVAISSKFYYGCVIFSYFHVSRIVVLIFTIHETSAGLKTSVTTVESNVRKPPQISI